MLLILILTGSWWPCLASAEPEPVTIREGVYADIPGWQGDTDKQAALAAFRVSCATGKIPVLGAAPAWRRVCSLAETAVDAETFFQSHFAPHRVVAPIGKLTGYYQASIRASRTRHGLFQHPVHGRPSDLVQDQGQWLQKTAGGMRPYPDRRAIMGGAIDTVAPVLFWADNPVDVFFAHIQGSSLISLDAGETTSIGFAARNGHPYTAVGKVLHARGALSLPITMQDIRAWMTAHPDDANALMAENASYIFFAEQQEHHGAVGAAGVPLTAGRSLAVDPAYWPYGVPIFVETQDGAGIERLMIAQDTGAAIRGPQRGDMFTGAGAAAADLAGRLNAVVQFTILLPKVMP